MGTTIVDAQFLDDGGSNWGNPQEHTAELTWHRTADTFSYSRDGEGVFAYMSAEEAEVLVTLFHEVGVTPRNTPDEALA